ncbi:MAG: DUF3341 domain-containing protein [Deltaproteobacteria bacterium]|nr:DUF3341 domain-containing protein [Deltaproteobacteria bacterium]
MATPSTPPTYGLAASFSSPDDLVRVVRLARAAGYRQMDAYTPMPVHGLAEALDLPPSRLPWGVLGGGITGMLVGIGLQSYTTIVLYPMNVGGRPLFSWPSFVPVTFELTILCAALVAVGGMIWRNGLPEPHHPIFNAPGFERASTDRFFLCIEATDPRFDAAATRRFLETAGAEEVQDVAR